MSFDPYHSWLGIRADEQPPNHYRLLGVSPFEDNPTVIDNAADRQMAHLRKFQTGAHAALSQRLLSEIAVARICLINPEKRAGYEADLRAKLAPKQIATGNPGLPAKRLKSGPAEFAKVVAGGLAGLVLAALLLKYVFGVNILGRSPAPKQANSRQVTARTGRSERPTPPTARTSRYNEPGIAPGHSTESSDTPAESTPAAAPSTSGIEEPLFKPGKKKAKKKGPGSKATAPSIAREPATPAVPTPAAGPTALQPKRLPMPPIGDQDAVKKTLAELYDLPQLKSEAEKVKVAQELLTVVGDAKDKPAEQFVALRQAADLAKEAGDARLLAECLDALAQRFEINLLQVESTLLAECAQTVRSAEAIEALVACARPVVLHALAEGDFETAKRLTDAKMAACNRPFGVKLRQAVGDRQKEINRQFAASVAYQQALTKLQSAPDDAAANLAAARWLAAERSDWTKALVHLARTGNPLFQKAAELELASPADPAAQLATGEAWYAAGQGPPKEKLWLVRAQTWYEQCQRGPLDALAAAKVEQMLQELARDAEVQTLSERIGNIGRLNEKLAAAVRRHCVLLFSFETDDYFSRSGESHLRDLSGRANHGAVHGATPTEGKAGKALLFDGPGDDVECADDPSLNPPAAMTICAWVRPSAGDYLVSKDDWKRGPHGYVLRFGAPGQPDFTVGVGTAWSEVRGPTHQPPGQWVHIAAVYDGQQQILLVNGEERGVQTQTRRIAPSSYPLRIGRGAYAPERRFQGAIDEVAIFDIALTSEDIQTIYALGQAGIPLAN